MKFATFHPSVLSINGIYEPVWLYLFLRQEILSSTGPSCPGITHVEAILNHTLKLESFGDFEITPINPEVSIYDPNFIEALGIMNQILTFEKELPVLSSGFLDVKRNFSTKVDEKSSVTFQFDKHCKEQYVHGSFMLTVKKCEEIVKDLLSNTTKGEQIIDNIPDPYQSSQLLKKYEEHLIKFEQNCGGDYIVSGKKVLNIPVGMMRVLGRLHLATATIIKKEFLKRKDNPGQPVILATEDVSLITPTLVEYGIITADYLIDDNLLEAERALKEYGAILRDGLLLGMINDAYEKLEKEFGITKNDINSNVAGEVTINIDNSNTRLTTIFFGSGAPYFFKK